jgi:predicted nucleotidyltransferase
MRKDEVLKNLAAHRDRIKGFSVKSLAIFGSVARGEAAPSSDVDVLVEFEPGKPAGLLLFIALKQYLEEILGCPVDLVTPNALRERMRDQVLREAIYAA